MFITSSEELQTLFPKQSFEPLVKVAKWKIVKQINAKGRSMLSEAKVALPTLIIVSLHVNLCFTTQERLAQEPNAAVS